MQRSWLLLSCTALSTACGGHGIPSDEELLAAHPDGEICNSIETKEMQVGDPAPAFLRGDGKLEGHGIDVPFGEARPDGSHLVHRWGPWIYYYWENSVQVAKESAGEFRDSHREGRWTFWHRNGRMRAEGVFTNSRMSGRWDCWLEDGSVDTEHAGEYRDDRRIGG